MIFLAKLGALGGLRGSLSLFRLVRIWKTVRLLTGNLDFPAACRAIVVVSLDIIGCYICIAQIESIGPATSQRITVPPSDPVARVRPSGEKTTLRPSRVRSFSPLATSHKITILSYDPEANTCPFGERGKRGIGGGINHQRDGERERPAAESRQSGHDPGEGVSAGRSGEIRRKYISIRNIIEHIVAIGIRKTALPAISATGNLLLH
jgi:hypothetical protein